MKVTRGWALFFGMVFCVMGLWYLMHDIAFGVRHGFNAPIMTDFSDYLSYGRWHDLALPPHHVLMPLHDAMMRHIEGFLGGVVIITACWWLAWRDKHIAQGVRTPSPYSNIHMAKRKRE